MERLEPPRITIRRAEESGTERRIRPTSTEVMWDQQRRAYINHPILSRPWVDSPEFEREYVSYYTSDIPMESRSSFPRIIETIHEQRYRLRSRGVRAEYISLNKEAAHALFLERMSRISGRGLGDTFEGLNIVVNEYQDADAIVLADSRTETMNDDLNRIRGINKDELTKNRKNRFDNEIEEFMEELKDLDSDTVPIKEILTRLSDIQSRIYNEEQGK